MEEEWEMKRLNPYLRFNGNCKQAMEFYQSCLGGKLNLMTVGDSPMGSQSSLGAQSPPEQKKKVMHGALEADDMIIMASDMMGTDKPVTGNLITLCINGNDRKAIEGYFNKLAAGGKVGTPIGETFFGMYGELVNKFGIGWMFEVNKTP